MRRQKMIGLGLTAAAVAGALLVPATPVSATALSCYGSARTINGADPNWHWPPYGHAYTTSNCRDINVKITRTVRVRTCFAPVSGGSYCNGYRTVYANTWGLAATDVKDGTKFWLLFDTQDVHGLAAY